ncbi:unnamed protein product [Vicia faba]|uniref:Uncharacterized protein n=1 Tax=Vicia faba TaxID=3906 RepID=A0AAV0Z8H5_VICFA|nr:unnamed protein product [Vicia faba]
MEVEEEGVMDMPDMWRNMALMSPTHSFDYAYEDINVQDYQDEEDFKIWFVTIICFLILHHEWVILKGMKNNFLVSSSSSKYGTVH